MLHSEINYDHVYYLRNYSVHRYILTSLVKSFIEQKEKKGKNGRLNCSIMKTFEPSSTVETYTYTTRLFPSTDAS